MAQGAIPPPDCSHACHRTPNEKFQQPFAFEILLILLFLFYQS